MAVFSRQFSDRLSVAADHHELAVFAIGPAARSDISRECKLLFSIIYRASKTAQYDEILAVVLSGVACYGRYSTD